jgi:hypothetical protein
MADAHRIDVTLTAEEISAVRGALDLTDEHARDLRLNERDDRAAGMLDAASCFQESAEAAERAAGVLRWLVGEGQRP